MTCCYPMLVFKDPNVQVYGVISINAPIATAPTKSELVKIDAVKFYEERNPSLAQKNLPIADYFEGQGNYFPLTIKDFPHFVEKYIFYYFSRDPIVRLGNSIKNHTTYEDIEKQLENIHKIHEDIRLFTKEGLIKAIKDNDKFAIECALDLEWMEFKEND